METYRHRRIHLYTAYLTTTIDGTFYRTITDDDIRIAFRIIGIGFAFTIFSHHGFITEEVVSNTLAASEYITFNRHAFVSWAINSDTWIVHIRCWRVVKGTDIHLRITIYISLIATTIDITIDIGTLNILGVVRGERG